MSDKYVPKYKLDGSEKIPPAAFDAHEQASRGSHVATQKDSPDREASLVQEFPKAVDHVEVDGHLEPVLANSAEHEQELKAAKESE